MCVSYLKKTSCSWLVRLRPKIIQVNVLATSQTTCSCISSNCVCERAGKTDYSTTCQAKALCQPCSTVQPPLQLVKNVLPLLFCCNTFFKIMSSPFYDPRWLTHSKLKHVQTITNKQNQQANHRNRKVPGEAHYSTAQSVLKQFST